jgi:hypothetical protein
MRGVDQRMVQCEAVTSCRLVSCLYLMFHFLPKNARFGLAVPVPIAECNNSRTDKRVFMKFHIEAF